MRANVYIRQENEETWKALANKSDVVNAILSEKKPQLKEQPTVVSPPEIKPINVGMACCISKQRCRHWSWNELDFTWTNTLTGEVVDEN